MLIFPHHVSKAEHMTWVCTVYKCKCRCVLLSCCTNGTFLPQKMLMAQWRRTVLGFAYDPDDEFDIKWKDEFSGEDFDSDEIHSEPRSDDSPEESTTDEDEEEDATAQEGTPQQAAAAPSGEEQPQQAAATPSGEEQPQQAAATPSGEEQQQAATAQSGGEERSEPNEDEEVSDSDTVEWCK